jgi:hypothetical protein
VVVVADQKEPNEARLTVAGSSEAPKRQVRQAITDGTFAIAVGGVVAGGFGVEAVKSFVTAQAAGRWWLVACAGVGVALAGLGWWLRQRARRRVRVGIVVTAVDGRRGLARAEQLDQQAEVFSRSTCALTLKVGLRLPVVGRWERKLVDALADETMAAATLAAQLTPDATRINLIPTMPLHAAFWFGARLGHTHAREISVHAIRQADGAAAYFPATALRAEETTAEPLIVDQLEDLGGGDPTVVALALDLQGRGDQFFDQVRAACRQHGVGSLLGLRGRSPRLAENRNTFTGVVAQTCRVWRDAPLTAAARTGRHAVFLSGPVAIAVALGARLAAPEHGRWSAFTFDADTNSYEAFPGTVSHQDTDRPQATPAGQGGWSRRLEAVAATVVQRAARRGR